MYPPAVRAGVFGGALRSRGELGGGGGGAPPTPPPRTRRGAIGQTLQGSFSAVSKRNFASKYFDESSRRELSLVRAISRAAVFLERNNCMIVKSRELSLRRGRILLAENAGAVYVELQGFYSKSKLSFE